MKQFVFFRISFPFLDFGVALVNVYSSSTKNGILFSTLGDGIGARAGGRGEVPPTKNEKINFFGQKIDTA